MWVPLYIVLHIVCCSNGRSRPINMTSVIVTICHTPPWLWLVRWKNNWLLFYMKETSSQLRQFVISLQISTQVHNNTLIVSQKPVDMLHLNIDSQNQVVTDNWDPRIALLHCITVHLFSYIAQFHLFYLISSDSSPYRHIYWRETPLFIIHILLCCRECFSCKSCDSFWPIPKYSLCGRLW